MVGLYEFLLNFDVIETTTSIKSKLYSDAIAFMQNELDDDQKKKDVQFAIEEKPTKASAEEPSKEMTKDNKLAKPDI
jgi:hypothetical protein